VIHFWHSICFLLVEELGHQPCELAA